MADQKEIALWREAHQNPKGQNIDVPEAALAQMAPFASLHAIDFIVYVEGKVAAPEVGQFLRAMQRELDWTYDNWAKAQRDSNAAHLLDDMINGCNAGGAETASFYGPIRKYLTDYAKANGLVLRTDVTAPNWMTALEQPQAAPGELAPMDPKTYPLGGAVFKPKES